MNLRNLHKCFFRAKERDSDDPELKEFEEKVEKRSSIFEKLFSEIWKRSNSSKSSATEAAYKFNRPRGTRTTTDCHPSDRQSGSFFDGTTMEHIVTNNSDVSTEMENTLGDVDAIVDAGQLYFSHRSNPSFNKPTIIQPVVDHISGVLENIRADILFIDRCEPENSAPHIDQLRACIAETWGKIQLRVQSPTEFLDMWGRVGDYQKFIHEIRLSIGANGVTEDMVEEFRRRLSDFDPASANVNASHDGAPRPLQAPSTNFFKNVQKADISGGYFVMHGPQTVVTESSAQSETYLKQIRDHSYLRTVVEIVFLF